MNFATPEQALAAAVDALQAGQLEETELICRQLLAVAPQCADAWNGRGLVALRTRAYPQAVEWFTRAIALAPDCALYHCNLGVAYQGSGRHAEAAASARRALTLVPDYAAAFANLGLAQLWLGEHGEAVTSLERALVLDANDANAWANLGSALCQQGDLAGATVKHRRALALSPESPAAWNGLAHVLHIQGDYSGALAALHRALASDPAHVGARWNLALHLLLHDDYPAGWKEFEKRWNVGWSHKHPLRAQRPKQPLWGGENIVGKTILLFTEQGAGDTFQCLRYVPMVLARGARVMILSPPPLQRLLVDIPGIYVWRLDGIPWHACDVYCPLMTLPRIFRTTIKTIPASVPYLMADPELADHWRGVMEPGRRNVGLVWAGNPEHAGDAVRSMALSAFAPLAGVEGVTFHSLQKGVAARQAGAPPEGMRLRDHAAALEDFRDTAALLDNLDLIITVDTAVAHLAGAMGKPVWVLLAFVPDWRWGLGRKHSPWYPTMRLFRQTQRGDWAPVIRRVAEELARWRTGRPHGK